MHQIHDVAAPEGERRRTTRRGDTLAFSFEGVGVLHTFVESTMVLQPMLWGTQ